jgi:RNA polymerase sigma-70 factor, ECF subfamily
MSHPSQQPDLTRLIEDHYEIVYRYAFRLSGEEADAEDLTQQTYLIAQSKLHQLKHPEAARSWLCSILRHLFFKSQSHGPTISLESVCEPEDALGEQLPPEFDSAALQQALNEIPEEFRNALVMYYLEELPCRRIAEVLDVPLGTVLSRLSRAREQLKRKLIALKMAMESPL